MADTADDDRLAEAFTGFRSEARQEIWPPGTQVVRRRRRMRADYAAVTLALLGGVGAVVITTGTRDRTPSAYPTVTSARSATTPWTASEALSAAELATQAFHDLPTSTFIIHTPVTAQTQGERHLISHFGSSPQRYVKGDDYDLLCGAPAGTDIAAIASWYLRLCDTRNGGRFRAGGRADITSIRPLASRHLFAGLLGGARHV